MACRDEKLPSDVPINQVSMTRTTSALSYIGLMPGDKPELSDVYLIDFKSINFNDAHDTARRSAVVKRTPFGTVGVIGRESKNAGQQFKGEYIYSPINPSHKFDHEGYWMSGNYKTLLSATFVDKAQHCSYLATLTEPEASDLKEFVANCRKGRKML